MSASTSNADFFGWDMLYNCIERTLARKSDVLIAFAHFVLIRHGQFRCVGIGEDKTLSGDERGSELLPEGWNNDGNKYALRYVINGQLYLLLGYKTEDCLILNLLDVNTREVSNAAFEPETMVRQIKGTLTELLPNASHMADRLRKELIAPVYKGSSRETTTQTNTNPSPQPQRPQRDVDPLRVTDPLRINDPLRIIDPMRPFGPPMAGGVPQPSRPFGGDYGFSDLDPLGRLGQGNLFPFPQRPELRGQGQPRFDPFGPMPDRNMPPNPNPDHLPAPGFPPDYYS